MNLIHRWGCRSRGWRKMLEQNVLPWALRDVDLGQDVLEVGPGPGLTTELLRARTGRLTAIEIDAALAHSLGARLRSSTVMVVEGDATRMPFANARFSGAVSFTMLHHVPSSRLQNELLMEVRRVLTPGGVFAGMDVRPSLAMRLLHLRDAYVPVDPATFGSRLEAAGFREILVEDHRYAFRFHALAAQAGW